MQSILWFMLIDQSELPNRYWGNGWYILKTFKGIPDLTHLIFEINVGMGRIRHRTTLNDNDVMFNRFSDQKIHHSISESLYVRSDYFRHLFKKMAWVWTTLNFLDQCWPKRVRRFLTKNRTKFIKYLFISLKSKWQKEVNCCIQNVKSEL